MTRTPEQRAEFRRIATDFVDAVAAKTVCSHCGATPIEWHNEDHPEHPNARVSSLRSQGLSIARIQQEMDRSEPLCRRCHMIEDGRLVALRASQPYQKGQVYVGKLPCNCCGKPAKPLRNGMCSTCDNHHSGRRLRRTRSCDGCCQGQL